MITGELESTIDSVWNDFWSGGISKPLEVTEQLISRGDSGTVAELEAAGR